MSETRHTPTPWRVESLYPAMAFGEKTIVGGIMGIAQIHPVGNGPDNAEYIVRCVNAHDDLLDVLQVIARGACLQQFNGDRCGCYSCLARAAIAKATE